MSQSKNTTVKIVASMIDKGLGDCVGVGGILARLFRKMLMDFNIDESRIARLIAIYVKDPINGFPQSRYDFTSRTGNYNKELGRPRLSWGKFIEGLKILQFEGPVEITIKGKSRLWNKPTEHSVTFVMAEIDTKTLEDAENDPVFDGILNESQTDNTSRQGTSHESPSPESPDSKHTTYDDPYKT